MFLTLVSDLALAEGTLHHQLQLIALLAELETGTRADVYVEVARSGVLQKTVGADVRTPAHLHQLV